MTTCASCGRENPGDARFCNVCGSALEAAPAPARQERKVVTVFFADLVGFTQRSEALDPEDVGALVAPYWDHVRAELERFGGTVEKFIGDAVMALFGAPVAHEDDPERAVRAALAIRDWARGHREIQVRVAVTTGEALVRLGARPDLGEGMASGDVVNTAARLQAAAPVNGVLVGEAAYRATRDRIAYREADAVSAKGKIDPIRVWEAIETRARFGVDVEQDVTASLVGRDRELGELRAALARARDDRAPQLVTLIGVPGMGKSRLVRELFDLVEADPDLILWRQGRSLPYGESGTFWALGEMVKAQAGILETDSAETAEAKLREAMTVLDDDRERESIAARLRPLVGLPVEEQVAGDRRSSFFAAWRRFLEALAEQRPLVLVFEDLHWADDDLLDFVDHLADWAVGVPMLLVATARPELLTRRPEWGGGKRNAAVLSLAQLAEDDTARLLATLLGRTVLPADLQSELLARAGGNPLFAEQYARMIVEHEGDGALAVPETVQGIIAARLDALPAEEKRLLQDASVLGKVFWVGSLAAIGGVEPVRVEELLHDLERKEFVQRERRSSVAGETEYAFRHMLLRDVAYNQITRAARADKHRRTAEWIERFGRAEDQSDLLAHHYTTALALARAAGAETAALETAACVALTHAGDRAAALNAFLAAADLYGAALELADPAAPDYAQLVFRRARALHAADQPAAGVLAEARDVVLAAGDSDAAGELSARLAHATWMAGNRAGALTHLGRAWELVRDAPPSPAKAYTLALRARLHMVASEPEQAIAVGGEARAMIEELGLEELRIQILNSLGGAKVHSGDVAGGMADLEESVAAARALNLSEAVRGYINLGSNSWDLGHPRRARESFESGLEVARELGSLWGGTWITAELSLLDYYAGEWDAALERADDVIVAVETSPLLMEAGARVVRGSIRAARGDDVGAAVEFERIVAIGRASQDPQTLYPAVAWAAQFDLDAGRRERASAFVDELLDAIGSTPALHTPSGWAVAAAFTMQQLGRPDQLAPHLATARIATPWADIAGAVGRGELADAADRLRELGDLVQEARVRLALAEGRHERRAGAQPHVSAALAFYRSVAASAYVARAEALLSATA